jgi:hypothetical protein
MLRRTVVCYVIEAWFDHSIKFDTRSIHIRQRSRSLARQIQQTHGVEHALCSHSRLY